MKKNMLLFASVLVFSTSAFSSDIIQLRETIHSAICQNLEIIPFIEDVVKGPHKEEIIAEIVSPNETHHGLILKEVTKQIFDGNYWVPQHTVFADLNVEELLVQYKPQVKDIDYYNIFLANLLYAAGSQYYDKTKDSEFLEYAASIGHAGAQYKMFPIMIRAKQCSEAANYILSAAAQKNPEALLKLSVIYQGGYKYLSEYFSKDIKMSKKLCQEAVEIGNHEAKFRIEVATLTEGFFDSKMNYQEGVRKAKELADQGNDRAKRFIAAVMISSAEALTEGDRRVILSHEDLKFLRDFLGWKDDLYEFSDDETSDSEE